MKKSPSNETFALSVRDLSIALRTGETIIDGIDFDVAPGGSLGIVGESGSGKTTLALALVGHIASGIKSTSGEVLIEGIDILEGAKAQKALRGRSIAYVPQDAPSALNPSMRVGEIVTEMLRVHAPDRINTDSIARAMALVDLPADPAFLRRYPHQLSGGQQQRLAIAAAMASEPKILVLDEPTTGLDMITQELILKEAASLSARTGVALIVISHDLEVVDHLCDRTLVLYAGRVAEEGQTSKLLGAPAHPYTRGLLEAVARPGVHLRSMEGTAPPPGRRDTGCLFSPRCPQAQQACHDETPQFHDVSPDHRVRCLYHAETNATNAAPLLRRPERDTTTPVLEVSDLEVSYRGNQVLRRVSLTVEKGERVALLGQSGSGKTTLGRCVAGLVARVGGEIRLNGTPLAAQIAERQQPQRRAVQMILQNPFGSFNPQSTIGEALSRTMKMLRQPESSETSEVADLLARVRLPAEYAHAYPDQLSGGELQRAAIAQALSAGPDLIICDEATSSLDVSVQAVVIELLRDLSEEEGVALLIISHDLGVVGSLSERTYVLENGHIVECAATEDLLRAPKSPLARRLIAARPDFVSAADKAPGTRVQTAQK